MFWSAKQAIKKAIERAGYTVHGTRTRGAGHRHIYPCATYALWLIDRDFITFYEQVRFQTMVDRYRCWEFWKLVEQIAKLPAGDFIEVGVCRDGSGCLIARKAKLLGLGPQVFLCDILSGVVKAVCGAWQSSGARAGFECLPPD